MKNDIVRDCVPNSLMIANVFLSYIDTSCTAYEPCDNVRKIKSHDIDRHRYAKMLKECVLEGFKMCER